MGTLDLEGFTQDYIRIHGRLYSHLPLEKNDDELAIILKGHLAIEELLRELIKVSVKHPKSIDEARFSFKQCLLLVKGIHISDENHWLWSVIDDLNKIRNKLAHNLEPKNIDNQIKELITSCDDNGSGFVKSANSFEFSELAMSIFDIHHQLWNLLKMHLTIKSR